MTQRGSVDDAIERRRRERDLGGDRLVGLRMDFALDGEALLSIGGTWDRRLGDFDGASSSGVLIAIHAGQRRAVEWFAAWLDAHAARRDLPPLPDFDGDAFEIDTDPALAYAALFAGGRRAGKSWLAVAFAVAYAIRFPGAIAWLVSPSGKKHDELKRYMGIHVAAAWIDSETVDGWELCNGSRILLKSAYDEEGLKEGEAHLVLLNEGQMMRARAYTIARGSIVDRSGLVLVCANPPVEAGDQQWVTDFASEAAAGRRAAVFLEFNPLENPHIDRRALLSMSADVDERTFAIEVLGQFRGPRDAVAYNWIRLENERPAPAFDPELGRRLGDVTPEFLAEIGEGAGIERVIGLDVQRFPHIGGPVIQFFRSPRRDQVIAWIVGEVVLEGGDEEDWCEALRESGYAPSTTLIVCDASGQYQHSRRRSTDEPPPEWRGRGSFDLIRGQGFRRIVPPSRLMKKNPEIVDRVRAFTSLIATKAGVRRLFADPILAPKTTAAIRDWRTVHGTPSRSQTAAHLGDAASYPIVRLFPRVLRSGKPGGVDPVISRVDLAPASSASSAADLRIVAPSHGPRRRDRFKGL